MIQARVYQSSESNIIFTEKIRSKRSWPVITAILQEEISKRDLYSMSPQNLKRANCIVISAQPHSRQNAESGLKGC